MKNLVTDKPAPITVALAQKNNVSQTLLKMEKNNTAQSLAQGVPVLVNPVIRRNTEAKTDLGLKMKIGPDHVHIA